MRIKFYYQFEMIIFIAFPYMIFSNDDIKENCDKNITKFLLEDCIMNLTNPDDKDIFKNDIIKMLKNDSLPDIVNKLNNNEIDILKGEDTSESYYLFNIKNPLMNLRGQQSSGNQAYINFKTSNCYRDCLYDQNKQYSVLQIENFVPSCHIPIIEYKIIDFNSDELECFNNDKDKTFEYQIPVNNINDNELYIYNMSDEYYTDECIPHKSIHGTDISIYSRKKYFNEKFLSPCQLNCTYKGYNKTDSKFLCDCKPMNYFLSNYDIYLMSVLNETNLLPIFDIEPRLTNFDLLKCYYLIASVDYILHNPGFYLLSLILLFLFIIIFLFIFKGYNSLSQRIDEAIKMKFHLKSKDQNKKLIIMKIKIKNKNNNNKIKKTNNNKKSHSSKNNKKENKSSKNIHIRRGSFTSNNNLVTTKINDLNKNQVTKQSSLNKLIDEKDENLYVFENDYELNMLNFDDALQCDNRQFCDIYTSFIKNKQLICFSLLDFNSYNSPIIKKVIFFLSFIYHYGINAFFFTDDILDNIFVEEGKYNPMILTPNAVYSAMVTTVLIKLMVDFLVLTEKKVLQIKKETTEDKANELKKHLMKITCIKLSIFFFINIILLIFFWFYLTCFNAVYPNTQIFLVINTGISFVISNIFPFIYYIIPSFIKNDILSNKNIKKIKSKTSNEYKDAEYVHSIGLFLQKF